MKKIIIIVLLTFPLIFLSSKNVWAGLFQCGDEFDATLHPLSECDCSHVDYMADDDDPPPHLHCCGWFYENICNASPSPINHIGFTNEDLDSFNPLKLFSTKADQLSTPGGIITEILKYAFPIAGMILFVMLIFAGIKMLTGATNSKNMDEGKQIIGTAIAGFIILFASYWIIQLIERIFGIRILGVW